MDFTINNQQKQNLFFWYNIIVKEKQMKNKTLQRVYKMLKPQTKAIIIISILSIIIWATINHLFRIILEVFVIYIFITYI